MEQAPVADASVGGSYKKTTHRYRATQYDSAVYSGRAMQLSSEARHTAWQPHGGSNSDFLDENQVS
jgi:hypothetical protein